MVPSRDETLVCAKDRTREGTELNPPIEQLAGPCDAEAKEHLGGPHDEAVVTADVGVSQSEAGEPTCHVRRRALSEWWW